MRGRHVFMESLRAHGVALIFGNPGTTESPLLDSLQDFPDIRYIVALHEGVAVGAASYYAQASGKTGVVNLHVAPGLGNAIGMLYGALKANSPLIVTAGQQDTRMRLREPLLGHDLVAMAAPVVKWSAQVERADEFGPLLQRAFKIANDPPRGPVFVALPINVMEQDTDIGAVVAGDFKRKTSPDPDGVSKLARLLLESATPAIIAGDDVARSDAQQELVALAERIGASVWVEGLRHQVTFPTQHPNFRGNLPFDAGQIRNYLSDCDLVLLIGGPFFEEVWFAPGSALPEAAEVVQIEESHARLGFNFPLTAGLVGSLRPSLAALNAAIDGARSDDQRAAADGRNTAHHEVREARNKEHQARIQRAWDREPMSMSRAMMEIRAAMPEDTIVVDESITANLDLAQIMAFDAPGDYFSGRGGGIGQGLAGAIGVKLGYPKRPVLCLSGDGSAMYSIQALWSAAHHDLAIVFVILANREYRVLKHNMDAYRQRFDAPSNRSYPHMDLTGPELGFVDLARGMGVAGVQVTKAEALRDAVDTAFQSGRPYLVEVLIEGKR